MKGTPFLGIVCMLVSIALFPVTDASVKYLLGTYSIQQTAFLRALMRLLCLLCVAGCSRSSFFSLVRTNEKGLHLKRVFVSTLSTFCFIAACKYGSLTLLYTLGYTSPIFMVLVSAFCLKEKVTSDRVFAVLLGMLGIIIAVRPTLSAEGTDTLFAASLILVGTSLAAFNKMYIRRLTVTENTLTIALYPNIVMLFLVFPNFTFVWQSMPVMDWVIFAVLGVAMALSQLLVAYALRCTQASLLAPLDYSVFLWVICIDFFFWSRQPDCWVLVGALCILLSNVWICLRGKQTEGVVRQT